MSVFSILNVGRTGMSAQSFGTHVSSQNATNAATEGYTRRLARIEPIPPPAEGGGGARALGSLRVIDPFVESRLLGASTGEGSAQATLDALGVLDFVFADAAGDVADALGNLDLSLGDLAHHPNELGAREAVLGALDTLVQAFRGAAFELDVARADINDRIRLEVNEVNGLSQRIAELGSDIAKAELGGREASDLRDQRDQLLRELSEVVPISVFPEEDGQVSVLLGGAHQLVAPNGEWTPISAQADPLTGDIEIHRDVAGVDTDITAVVDGGSIGGLVAARDGALTTAEDALDQLAFDIANAYNGVHTAGFGLDGVGGRNLFEPPAAVPGAARNLAVSVDVDGQPTNIGAAQDPALLPGDNRQALELQALADSRFAAGGTQTALENYAAIVAQAGSAVRSAQGSLDRASAQKQQIYELRQAVSGVSTDEEMVNLVEFQRGYQATLKIIQTADEMLQDLLAIKR